MNSNTSNAKRTCKHVCCGCVVEYDQLGPLGACNAHPDQIYHDGVHS